MRRFTQVVTIPAGAVWPDFEGGKPLQYFRFAYIQNRATQGSGNDLWVGFGGKRPAAGDIQSADEVIPAGAFLTYNLTGQSDDEGDAEATHQLFIRNVGAASVVCKVELDQEPIEVTSQPVFVGATSSVVTGATTPGDAVANPNDAVDARALNEAWNGATWDRLRTPNAFHTATGTAAGATAIWTPAAGKRFRLMAYSIELTGNAAMAAAGLNEITLAENGAPIGQGVSAWLPAAAGTTLGNVPLSGGMRQLGNGYLAAAVNTTLQLVLGTALSAGEVRVNAIGTEE